MLCSVLTVILLLAGWFTTDLSSAMSRNAAYNELILESFSLNSLINAFQVKPNERVSRQLGMVLDSLGAKLALLSPNKPGDQFLLDQMLRNEQELGILIEQMLFFQRETEGPLNSQRQPMLTSQIRIKVQSITDDIGRLMQSNQEYILSRQNKTAVALLALVALLFLTTSLTFYIASRRLVRGVRTLTTGADNFASGNLGHRIDLQGKDELAELGSAFNHMAESLQDSNDILQHHAQMLEQSNRELEQFAYVASHDLQEPLRKIQAFGSLLRREIGDQLEAKPRDYLIRMEKAAERMRELIEALLGYSRIMKLQVSLDPVDLNAILKEVLWDLEPRITENRGQVESMPLPVVHADPTQMRQLFQNLIGNALKFHKEGVPPEVRICAICKGQGPERLCELMFSDNGLGFEMEYLDKLFTPFQRLHNRSKYEGTGIGLAICRMIAERHNGSITARSTPGHGSTFIVTLPAMPLEDGTARSSLSLTREPEGNGQGESPCA